MTTEQQRAYYSMVRGSWAESFFFVTDSPDRTLEAYADFRGTCAGIMSKLGLPETGKGWTRAAQLCFVWMNRWPEKSDWKRYHNETPRLTRYPR
tara:strand:+ start:237 stop:518 length:282 start_codon:yes stop_codon:yes gene_type:complete